MSSDQGRYSSIDIGRGSAVVLMILYHFCFDLNQFQILSLDFYHDPFWLSARTFIVSLFLFLVGVSLVLSARRGLSDRGFQRSYTRRLLGLLLCAALVSLVSYGLTPSRWIFFGILHFIVVASLLGLLFVGRPVWSLCAATVLLSLGLLVSSAWFDQPALQWLGLMTHKPQTEDYVPLLPWFGVVLLGMALAPRLLAVIDARRPGSSRPLGQPGRWLRWLGRHSLLIYMLHQPILLGILVLITGRGW